jgi:uncharacterized membrane protein
MALEIPSIEKLTRGEIITALSHYYRAEVTRSLAWRERLDRTTNWAVGSAAAFLGFGFSHPEIHHSLFLFALAIVYTMLFLEARRYRFYDAYEYRVKLLNQYFIYGVLNGRLDLEEGSHWVTELASDLRYPQYKMGLLYALGRRLKGSYIYIFLILLAGWLLKIRLHPLPAHSWRQYLDQATLVGIPGWMVLLFIPIFLGQAAYLLYLGRKPLGGRDIFYTVSRKEEGK